MSARDHLEALHCWEPEYLDSGWTGLELVDQHREAHDLEDRHSDTFSMLYRIAFPHSRIDLGTVRPATTHDRRESSFC
jgi:hypothetical protein